MPLIEQSAHRKDQDAGYANMQHRHFATVAKIISHIPYTDTRLSVREHFANELAKTNPKFDRERFMWACNNS